LVTGANRGLGLGLSRELVRRGWQVFAGCRETQRAAALAGPAVESGGRLQVIALDVRRDAVVSAAIAQVAAHAERLDVLVNNAGINPAPRDLGIAEVPAELVAEAMDVNLLGPLRLIQAALPLLRKSGRPRVVNISSGAGSLGHGPAHLPPPAYCLSKAALNMLTRRAARELAGLTIVSVSPGWIRTDMGGAGAELSLDEAVPPLAAMIEGLVPAQSGQWLDRFGRPSEYAW
jgi:NAD(P)-dependent dehydrogenase (short-subunit alcohol dehydrogenase family)